jgi:hypothetical protein
LSGSEGARSREYFCLSLPPFSPPALAPPWLADLEQRHDEELQDADAAEDAAEGDHDGAGAEHAEDEVLHGELDGSAAAAVRDDALCGAGLRVVHPAGAEDGPRGGEEADEVCVPCRRREGSGPVGLHAQLQEIAGAGEI